MSPILKEQLMYNNLTVNEACGDLLELIKNYVTQHSLNFGRNCYLLNRFMGLLSHQLYLYQVKETLELSPVLWRKYKIASFYD